MKLQSISQLNNNTYAFSLQGEPKTRRCNPVNPTPSGLTNLNHSPISIVNQAQITFGAKTSESSNDIFNNCVGKAEQHESYGRKALLDAIRAKDFDPNQRFSTPYLHSCVPLSCDLDYEFLPEDVVREIILHPDLDVNLNFVDRHSGCNANSHIIKYLVDHTKFDRMRLVLKYNPNIDFSRIPRHDSFDSYNTAGISLFSGRKFAELLNDYEKGGGRELARMRCDAANSIFVKNPNAVFEDAVKNYQKDNECDIATVIKAVKSPGFDPNKKFIVDEEYESTPIFSLAFIDQTPAELWEALLSHPDLDINLIANDPSLGHSEHILEYLIDHNKDDCVDKIKLILENNPNIDLSKTRKCKNVSAIRAGKEYKDLLNKYETGGGRERARTKWEAANSQPLISPNQIFESTMRDDEEWDVKTLLKAVRSHGFDPNKKAQINGDYETTAIFNLASFPDSPTEVWKGLLYRSDLDINLLANDPLSGEEKHILEYLVDSDQQDCVDKMKLILENNPYIDFSKTRNNNFSAFKKHVSANGGKYSKEFVKLLDEYETARGRERARVRWETANLICTNNPNLMFESALQKISTRGANTEENNPEIGKKLVDAVKMPGFDPNKKFFVNNLERTPMFHLTNLKNTPLDVWEALLLHPALDINVWDKDFGYGCRTHILKLLIYKETTPAYVDIIRLILENNPYVDFERMDGAGFDKLRKYAAGLGKNYSNKLVKLLDDYETGGGRERALEKWKAANPTLSGASVATKTIDKRYSEMNADQLLALFADEKFQPASTADLDGNFIIHAAAAMKNPRSKELISLANERIKNIDVQNDKGQTPAMLVLDSLESCGDNRDEKRICYGILKFILELKPSLSITDDNGLNLEDYATELNSELVKQMLEQYKATKKD